MIRHHKADPEVQALIFEGPCTAATHQLCTLVPMIQMHGYAEGNANILLCEFCAKQLARKLLEDLCDLAGDRHG